MEYSKKLKWQNGELYYMDDPVSGWKHYTTHPLRRPDLPERNSSKGFPTMQLLLSQGYVYATPKAD